MLINHVKRMRRGDQWWPVLRGIGSKLDSPKNYVQNQFQKTRLHFLKTHIISFEEVGKKKKTYFSSLCVQYVWHEIWKSQWKDAKPYREAQGTERQLKKEHLKTSNEVGPSSEAVPWKIEERLYLFKKYRDSN